MVLIFLDGCSVLGPILFLILINDIAHYIIANKLTVFADDTSATVSSKNIHSLSKCASECFMEMSRYCSQNGLVLNQTKTESVFFYPSHTSQDVSILVRGFSGSLIQNKSVKFLGIHLDSTLT